MQEMEENDCVTCSNFFEIDKQKPGSLRSLYVSNSTINYCDQGKKL